MPQGNMRITVPAGTVDWQLYQTSDNVKPAYSGSLTAVSCGHYIVRVGFDPRQKWENENINF
jgi:hypothetical protein